MRKRMAGNLKLVGERSLERRVADANGPLVLASLLGCFIVACASGNPPPTGGGLATGTAPAGAGTAPAVGGPPASALGLFVQCQSDEACDMGLACYTYGNYCSAICATDSDCQGLGPQFSCYLDPMDQGAAGLGLCRVVCEDDSACPPGLACRSVAPGSMRCGYPVGPTAPVGDGI